MLAAVLLAVAASFCTATASIAQRQGAKTVEMKGGFDVQLIFRLARRPVWLLGVAAMIGGFLFQITALRYGALALVQPDSLVRTAARLRLHGHRRATAAEDQAPRPAGGCRHVGRDRPVPRPGVAIGGTAARAWLLVAAGGPDHARPRARRPRRGFRTGRPAGRVPRAGAPRCSDPATGIAWGFVAAVIKELSSHLGAGPGALFSTWSLYVLVGAGAATMLLASHALAAGPLAASQPGFTVLDPLAAALLGIFLFGEHIQTAPWALAGEAFALLLVLGGAVGLSRSCFILGERGDPSCLPADFLAQSHGKAISRAATGGRP